MNRPDFAGLTERRGMHMPREQRAMAATRYGLLADHGAGRRVLEVGCGTGFGLDHAADGATFAVGCDLTWHNLAEARGCVDVPLAQADASALPFRDSSFDVIALFEVVYYLSDVEGFLQSARRLLAPGGSLLICLPNRDRVGFHASPHSTHYFGVPELRSLLESAGYDAEVFGAFPTATTALDAMITRLTGIAQRLRLVPDSLAGRERIKRILFRNVTAFEGLTNRDAPTELVALEGSAPDRTFKNLYAIATTTP